MTEKQLCLASRSPRRIELMQRIGLEVFVCPTDVDENVTGTARQRVELLARRKALHVANGLSNALVIGADTLVSIGDQILGKPCDEQEAFQMLKSLCGNWHTVYTGVCVTDSDTGRILSCAESTRVHMQALTDQQIWSYIKSGEPMDKAGAYGIQEKGGSIVDRIEGDFYNVMGLPLVRVRNLLEKMGVSVF